jgi:hypothetical protein
MAERHLYRIVFQNQGKIYEIYARKVSHGAMLGFVEVEQLDFGQRQRILLDPAEERIKAEFEGVKRTYLPMHCVLRIDEVDKRGVSKVSEARGNVTPFPGPIVAPTARD